MRSDRNHRPHWSLLYPILLLSVGGLVLEHHLHLSQNGHKVILLLVIAIGYSLMGLWIKSNAAALQDLDGEDYRKQRRDPAVYGTPEFPTQTQFHYQEAVSLYRPVSTDERESK